ncbi:GNAT family N-acetyltransferase [Candidatus Bathyarchaeota archaeon]|nr:MAG: GNAT family N-acetyltransferase [Candidatus Bathyarchaeota archaeon]
MKNASSIRPSTSNDYTKIKQIIDLSFPRFFRYFANQSVISEDGKVLVSEDQSDISGFAKLIEFNINSKKYGCILWIAVHPSCRRKGIAYSLANASIDFLKNLGAQTVLASTQTRNNAAQATLGKACFKRADFLGLWRVFGWKVLSFYSKIWYAPGEVIFIHNS